MKSNIVINSLVVAGALVFIGLNSANADQIPTKELDEIFRKKIINSKIAVAERMKDPSSVQFRGVRKGMWNVCGEFNAKNSYGGYVGYKRFIYMNENLIDFEGDSYDSNFEELWNKVCVDKK